MLKLLFGEPALLLENPGERTLIAADLHIGFEKELASRGVKIPSQTPKMLRRLKRLIERFHVKRLILLGDIKHGTSKVLPHEWMEVPEFFEDLLTLVSKMEVIPGNHDGGLTPLLPREVVTHPSQGVIIRDEGKNLALTHGHAWPQPEALASDRLVMGHHHFTVEFRDPSGLRMVEPVWLAGSCDRRGIAAAFLKAHGLKGGLNPLTTFRRRFGVKVRALALTVMPPFNPMLGGVAVNLDPREYLGPILGSGGVDIAGCELYLLDGTYLGRLYDFTRAP